MQRKYRNKYLSIKQAFLLVLFVGLAAFAFAQGSPPPPPPPPPPPAGGGGTPPCWPPPCIPIDNGISLLLIAGVYFGYKTVFRSNKSIG